MSSHFKFAVIALLAFALGAAVGRLAPGRHPASADALAWETDGGMVRLTATSPGASYLILESGNQLDPAGSSDVTDGWNFGTTLTLRPPSTVYRLEPWGQCPLGAQCNRCSEADGCVPPPKGPWPYGTRCLLWNPDAGR